MRFFYCMNNKPKRKVYVKSGSWIAAIAARKLRTDTVAIVIGRTIHLYNASVQSFLSNKCWLLHELKHVEQYEQLGFFRFIYTYLRESMKNGYHGNVLEVEARRAEQETTLLEKYELVSAQQ